MEKKLKKYNDVLKSTFKTEMMLFLVTLALLVISLIATQLNIGMAIYFISFPLTIFLFFIYGIFNVCHIIISLVRLKKEKENADLYIILDVVLLIINIIVYINADLIIKIFHD